MEHDKPSPSQPGIAADGNTVWPGVDFRIENAAGWIWLEVKNWEPNRVPPRRRGGNRRSFFAKMRSKPFAQEMRGKFLGTTAYLAWKSGFTPTPTRFILLFEPPNPLDAALLSTFLHTLQGQLPVPRPWRSQIRIAAVTLAEWNRRFPDYPARL